MKEADVQRARPNEQVKYAENQRPSVEHYVCQKKQLLWESCSS